MVPAIGFMKVCVPNKRIITVLKSYVFIYVEEVFSANSAVWFSPDGSKLAYIRFDDRNVHLMNIPIYGTPGTIDSQYTQSIGIHYPKVGSPNPIVTLFTVDLNTLVAGQPAVSQALLVPEALRNEDHIISAVGWQNNNTLASSWMNRVQNRAFVQACTGSVCQVVRIKVSLQKRLEFLTFRRCQFSSRPSHHQLDGLSSSRHCTSTRLELKWL